MNSTLQFLFYKSITEEEPDQEPEAAVEAATEVLETYQNVLVKNVSKEAEVAVHNILLL